MCGPPSEERGAIEASVPATAELYALAHPSLSPSGPILLIPSKWVLLNTSVKPVTGRFQSGKPTIPSRALTHMDNQVPSSTAPGSFENSIIWRACVGH